MLTVDVEDYYSLVARDKLGVEVPVSEQLDREMEYLLDLIDELEVRATCFVVGKVAEDRPQIVREIVARGHEIASHTFDHRLMDAHTPRSFKQDLTRSIRVLEDVASAPIHGFRAPAFSLGERHRWAFQIMAEAGIRYDSSVRIVWPWGRERGQAMIDAARACGIEEIPGFAMGWGRFRAPLAGGGGLRHLPAAVNRRAVAQVRRAGFGIPIYIHPYDLSISRPEVKWPVASLVQRIRCAVFDRLQRRGRSKVAAQLPELLRLSSLEERPSVPEVGSPNWK
jgi:polysaccharide deacetylase family protein (PEP-CTERM system associated)